MKRRTEKVLWGVFLVFQALLFGVMILFAVTLTNKVSASSRDMLNKHALTLSEKYMRERVETIISLIEQEQENTLEGVRSIGSTIYQNMVHQDEEKLEEFLVLWVPKIEQMQYGDLIQLILHDRQSNRYSFYYHDQANKVPADIYSYEIMEYVNRAPYSKKVEYQYKTLYILASQESIDKKIKEHIYGIIHGTQYGRDGFVWVNEVLNYEGGDSYAIRRIHPNLKSTEGQYLSTNMQDIAGNYPYLNELKEINENGEVFHTYYFKNRRNDVIREKASYAKLYEPYNWIIATGNPLDDVLLYSTVLDKDNQASLSKVLGYTIVILVFIFLVDILLIIFNNKKLKEKLSLEEKIANSEKELKQADYEAMTGLLRRGPGEEKINHFLRETSEPKGTMIAVDLDDLKGINDTLGHKAGDEAIIGIAEVLKMSFRQTDIILRYGGDEFVIFIPEEEGNINTMNPRMESLIRKLSFVSIGDNKERNIHCSIGITSVKHKDTFETIFSRVDKALYHVKRNGKNNFAFYTPEMEKEDYSFRNDVLLTRINPIERENLLKVISDIYPFVMSVNISKNTYYFIKRADDSFFSMAPEVGYLNDFVGYASSFVEPTECDNFKKMVSKEGLIKKFDKNRQSFSFYTHFSKHNHSLEHREYREGECNISFYTNNHGDVCGLTTFRWLDMCVNINELI